MRVVEQLIDHLRGTGHLTDEQLAELRRMGLVRDKQLDYDDYYGDFDSGPIPIPVEDPDDRIDELDSYGDRLSEDATQSTRRRAGRRLGTSRILSALEDGLTAAADFADLVGEVAQRLNPGSDVDDASRLVRAAAPAELEAVLIHGSLWAALWPHLETEPIVSRLHEGQRRRLGNLLAAGDPAITARSTRHDPALGRSIDLIEAHRTLESVFNRVTSTLEPRRVFSELRLFDNPVAYETLVILFNARAEPRTIGELPNLGPDVGLPIPAWLPESRFVDGWAIAARLDPLRVLPFLQRCAQPWSTLEKHRWGVQCRKIILPGRREEYGNWIPQSASEWFSLHNDGLRWLRRRHRPRGYTQSDAICTWVSTQQRAEYGLLWAAGMLDMPLLTCPKEWEPT